MIDGKRVLALVPARGGSKGLPRKNVLLVGGRPLIAWTVEAARASRLVDRVVLSSEDPEIATVAEAAGCEVPFTRPAELASDSASMGAVIVHALEALDDPCDYLVLLQPTSPLRSGADIDGAVELCHTRGAPACVSVTEPAKSPYWTFHLDDELRMSPVVTVAGETPNRRQELPKAFAINGAVYVARVPWLRERGGEFYGPETIAYRMPRERSLDIDEPYDMQVLRALVASERGG